MKLLLEKDGNNVTVRDDDGMNALLLATQNGHEAIALLLLSSDRCDPDTKTSMLLTPLSYAAEYGTRELSIGGCYERPSLGCSICNLIS